MERIRGMLQRCLHLTQGVTAISVGTFIFNQYICSAVLCSGPSMQPTLFTSDILLTEQISPRLGRIDLGDIVVARIPGSPGSKCVCKRVVALSGDSVQFRGQNIKVPERHCWLEGDNKLESWDSREWGPVPLELVRRRCICKIWPKLDISFGSVVNYHLEASVTGEHSTTAATPQQSP